MPTNTYNREWEELDSIRAQALIEGAFTLVSEKGEPLCGRWTGEPVELLIAKGWQ